MLYVAGSFPSETVFTKRDDIVIPAKGNVIPMGSIRERARQDGSIGYTAQIILKRKGKPTHREAKTFSRRNAAVAWLKNREAELRQPGGIESALVRGKTLADAIDRAIEEDARVGRTKAQVLRSIKEYPIARMVCGEIGSANIVAFARELASGDRKPQTVGNYLSHLGAIFAIAKPAWGYPLDQQAMKDAFTVVRRLGLSGKSGKRDRRPTLDELDRILRHFDEVRRNHPDSAPMVPIIVFALFSTRRQEEITRIKRADFEPPNGRVLVRDMKHPGQKVGNDVWCDLPPEAVAIAEAMPGQDAIFPFNHRSISAAFTRACKFLQIEDLHFHDLRHEGVSRLFEMGKGIPDVALVSAHRSWSSLQRYSHIRQRGDKYAGWPWLQIAIERARALPACSG